MRLEAEMALLQISEPGQSPEPQPASSRVGNRPRHHQFAGGRGEERHCRVLNDHDGHALLPSIVRYLRDGGVAVGREAEAEQARDPRNTIVSVKRFIGARPEGRHARREQPLRFPGFRPAWCRSAPSAA